MAGKDEVFIDWEDLDLADFLGDFQGDRMSVDEGTEDDATAKKKTTFQCPLCDKSYKSQSGFRSHVLKKHNRKDLKASDHLQQSTGQVTDESPITTQTTCRVPQDLTDLIREATEQTLHEMEQSPFHNLTESVHGGHIIFIAGQLKSQSHVLLDSLSSQLKRLFEDFAASGFTSLEREVFFSNVHTLKMDFDLLDRIESSITDSVNMGDSVSYVPVFLACFLDNITSSITAILMKKLEEECHQQQAQLTNEDQKVLHLIAGFLIFAEMKSSRHDEEKRSVLEKLTDTEDSRKEDFLGGMKSWTKKCDRGGLKHPCDTFFMIIRIFETEARKFGRSGLKNALTEVILANTVVNQYWDNLVRETYKGRTQLLESIIKRFLKVRSHALARKLEREATKASKKKRVPVKKSSSLRSTLKQ